jgi:acetolactate synthase-1/2/3 large subunit
VRHAIIAFLDGGKPDPLHLGRHEQVAAHAADGYARASGKVGVLMTHLGPGLTNAATGVANAALDSIPMVVIAGDVPTYYYGRHPHQEVNLHQDADQCQIFRPFCKRVYRVDNVRDPAHRRACVPRPRPASRSGARRRAADIFSADLAVDALKIAKPGLDRRPPRGSSMRWRPAPPGPLPAEHLGARDEGIAQLARLQVPLRTR